MDIMQSSLRFCSLTGELQGLGAQIELCPASRSSALWASSRLRRPGAVHGDGLGPGAQLVMAPCQGAPRYFVAGMEPTE